MQQYASVDAILRRRYDGEPELSALPAQSCHSCGMCGAASKRIMNDSYAQHTRLRLSLPVNSLLAIVARLYGIPLTGLIIGAHAAAAAGFGELATVAGALFGGAAALACSRRSTARLERLAASQLRVRSLRAGAIER